MTSKRDLKNEIDDSDSDPNNPVPKITQANITRNLNK